MYFSNKDLYLLIKGNAKFSITPLTVVYYFSIRNKNITLLDKHANTAPYFRCRRYWDIGFGAKRLCWTVLSIMFRTCHLIIH